MTGGECVTETNSYYDALGRRYESLVSSGSGDTTAFSAFDGFNVLETYSGSSYIASLLGQGLDELYLEDFNGTVQSSVLKGALGSEVGLTNPGKGLTDSYSYEPYGAPTHNYGSTLDPGQFAGIPYDGNSGLYYMRHRWYLPAIGRFISRDPIGIAGGINVYAYANDDPIDLSDPTGLCSNPTYDGPSEGGNTQQGANNPSGEGPGQGIGGYLSYPGFTPGVGIVTGIVGGPPSLQQNGLLPARGGAGPGGDVPEIYYGQNGGGIWLVQELRRPPSSQPPGLQAFSACAGAFMAFNPELVAACGVTLGACLSGAGAVHCGSAGVTCGLWASALGLCYRSAYRMGVPQPSPEYNVPSP